MTWLAAAWSWFIGTKVGRWIVGVCAVVAALGAALLVAFVKGRQHGKREGLADAAEQAVKDARAAQQVTTDAAQAAEQVRQDAAKQPPPDPVKRDDLDTNF